MDCFISLIKTHMLLMEDIMHWGENWKQRANEGMRAGQEKTPKDLEEVRNEELSNKCYSKHNCRPQILHRNCQRETHL